MADCSTAAKVQWVHCCYVPGRRAGRTWNRGSVMPWKIGVPIRKPTKVVTCRVTEGAGGDRRHYFKYPSLTAELVFALLSKAPSPSQMTVQAWVKLGPSVLFVAVVFLLGTKTAFAPRPTSRLPVFACLTSGSEYASALPTTVSLKKEEDDTSIMFLNREPIDEGHESEGNADEKASPRGIANAEGSHRTSNQGGKQDPAGMMDGDLVEELGNEFEDDEDDACDEFDDTLDADERMPNESTNLLEPYLHFNESLEGSEHLGEAKELERAYEEWRATPYKLTVPLRVVGLRGSVPSIWLKDFILSQGRRVRTKFEFQNSLRDIFSSLTAALEKKKVKPQSILSADLVTIGDSWLKIAVSGRLIEPIDDAEQQDWFRRLSPQWQAFLRRDLEGHLNSRGLIWGVPYRWGSMVIAYRSDKLAKLNISDIKDWKDLWKPELAGKIAMVNSPREVVGAVLKSLGLSYNVQDFDKDVPGGKEAVKQQYLALLKQVRLFDSIHYLKALGSADVWVAVGWSSDVIPVAKRMSNMCVVAPESGMSLWADLWAIPAATAIPTSRIGSRVYGASPLVHQWFEFCLQPVRALPFRQGVFVGASPLHLFEGTTERNLPWCADAAREETSNADLRIPRKGPEFQTNLVEGMPPRDILSKSEFLEPLSEKAVADYEWLLSHATTVPRGNTQPIVLLLGGLRTFLKVLLGGHINLT